MHGKILCIKCCKPILKLMIVPTSDFCALTYDYHLYHNYMKRFLSWTKYMNLRGHLNNQTSSSPWLYISLLLLMNDADIRRAYQTRHGRMDRKGANYLNHWTCTNVWKDANYLLKVYELSQFVSQGIVLFNNIMTFPFCWNTVDYMLNKVNRCLCCLK